MARKRDNVMLARPAELSRIQALPQSFFVQPKLKGGRGLVEYFSEIDALPTLYSSTRKEKPFLLHLKKQLHKLPSLPYDGEFYKHGMPESEINSRVSRTVNRHPHEDDIEFHIYDVKLPDVNQAIRINMLESIKSLITKNDLTHIKVVQTEWVTHEDWYTYLQAREAEGYEGIIFRNPTAYYVEDRSVDLLKLKPTETDIYQIQRIVQGTGWCYDRCGSIEVRDKNGNLFEVGTGPTFTKDKRMWLWDNREFLRGKYLLVKHEKLRTVNDLPISTVGMSVLTDEEVLEYLKLKHNDLVSENV